MGRYRNADVRHPLELGDQHFCSLGFKAVVHYRFVNSLYSSTLLLLIPCLGQSCRYFGLRVESLICMGTWSCPF